MNCPPVFWITFSIKTSQTVTIFEIIKSFIPEILRQLDMTPKIWSKIPETIKMSSFLESFKAKLRQWKPECDCCLCTTYLYHVGFVNVI